MSINPLRAPHADSPDSADAEFDGSSQAVKAQQRLRDVVQSQPVLVQISAAKRLRDQAEQLSQAQGQSVVTEAHVNAASRELGLGVAA